MLRCRPTVILVFTLICCVAMAVVDAKIRPGYIGKSAVKLALFAGLPLLYARAEGSFSPRALFRRPTGRWWKALLLSAGVFGIIVGGYFLLRGVFDFSGITAALGADAGVNAQNFVFVAIYISIVNSLLEEFFFRGFVFANLLHLTPRWFAYGFSAAAFSLYHVCMMSGWFSVWGFVVSLVGLAAGALIFDRLVERSGSLFFAWLVHLGANLGINTVGLLLFSNL